MRTRPKELTGLALAFIGIAASFPVQVMLLYGDSPLDPEAIFTKLAPLNWLVMGLSVAMIPLTLRASPALWAAIPLYIGAVTWNNWLLAAVQGPSGWISSVHFSTVGLVSLFVTLLLSPSCRMAIFHPRKRWWLTPQRKRVRLDARLCPVLGGEVATKTFDLSESGIFVALDEGTRWLGPRLRSSKVPEQTLRVGSYCWLRVALNDVSAFICTAEIVRKTDPRGIYPAGVGLRFVALSAKEKKLLSSYLKSVEDAAPAVTPQQSAARGQPERMAA